jgi:hypothetical protein
MNDALLATFNEIQALIVQAEKQDIEARYTIALLCCRVRDGDGNGGKYGSGAVKKLAAALGPDWSKSRIYDYARVAEAWPNKEDFDKLAGQVDKYGNPLSWSHIVLLATVADDEPRDVLIGQVLEDGLGIRDLRKNLRNDPPRDDTDEPSDAPPKKLPRALELAFANYQAQFDLLDANTSAFGGQIDQNIHNADADVLTDAFSELAKARQKLEAVFEANIERLDAWMKLIQERREVSARSQDAWGEPDAPSSSTPQVAPEAALVSAN